MNFAGITVKQVLASLTAFYFQRRFSRSGTHSVRYESKQKIPFEEVSFAPSETNISAKLQGKILLSLCVKSRLPGASEDNTIWINNLDNKFLISCFSCLLIFSLMRGKQFHELALHSCRMA